jgi:hypothetical protein
MFPVGRISWHEIRAFYPLNPSLFGVPVPRLFIGLGVTDSYLQRKSALIRFRVWFRRHFSSSGDLEVPAKILKGRRDEILQVLQDGLGQYGLRSISEAKELESGG